MSTPEGIIKKSITDALKQMGYRTYRIQCGRWKVRGGWMWGAEEGTPDTWLPVMIQGLSKAILWLEFKTIDGKLRQAQITFRDELPVGEYWLSPTDLDTVLEFLKRHRCTPK